MIEIFPVSFDVAVDLLEFLGDTSSEAVPMAVVVFSNDRDAVHYRLRWAKVRRLIGAVWTIPLGACANSWIAENAPDSEVHEWVSVWFPSEKRRDQFFSELVRASGATAPNDGATPTLDD